MSVPLRSCCVPQDVGGQDQLRPYWRHYYTGTQGIIYVVDATDAARLELATLELRTLAKDDQLAVSAGLCRHACMFCHTTALVAHRVTSTCVDVRWMGWCGRRGRLQTTLAQARVLQIQPPQESSEAFTRTCGCVHGCRVS